MAHKSRNVHRPLADKLRPQRLSDLVGQEHLLGPEGQLIRFLENNVLTSFILWGPPGTGKTTIARLMAQAHPEAHYVEVSAIFTGTAELKKIFEEAKQLQTFQKDTILFVDEIHRFNRAQQDCFLPFVENGTLLLIGATTQNPSFELNAALLSRMRVFTLHLLTEEALSQLLLRAEQLENKPLPLTSESRQVLIQMADGDGRVLLSLAEDIWRLYKQTQLLNGAQLGQILQRRAPRYDKNKDEHYNLISALHKAVRGSDPDAALYYFTRMMQGGEEPRFLARRLIRMAVEDISLADPQALLVAQAAKEAYEFLGSPEGELALAQAVLYLACAPKSNAAYIAYKKAVQFAKETGSVPPPKTILNAPTPLMQAEGYQEGYIYDHDTLHAFSGQNYFPESLGRPVFYAPVERGFEREIKKRLAWWQKLRQELSEKF